jgi:hypothetical protein
MTAGAVGTKPAAVHIIVSVTRLALRKPLAVFRRGRGMTLATNQISVPTFQRKIGLLIVIENPRCPCIGVMAVSARIAQCPLVMVVRFVALDTGRRRIPKLRGGVATLARSQGVLTDQRERGEIVLEPHLPDPALLDMAVPAPFTLLPAMYVASSMAVVTLGNQSLSLRCDSMAPDADQFLVGPSQREPGIFRMGEPRPFPLRGGVTVRAIRPGTPPMHVVVSVAIPAFALVLFLFRITPVARGATQSGVRAVQLETGFPIVIELALPPRCFVVATLAFLTIAPFVPIVPAMAGNALSVQLGVGELPSMTCITLRGRVFAAKRKLRLFSVVEIDSIPGLSTVTIRALLSVTSTMNIVYPVARHALPRSLPVLVIHVAEQAGYRLVTTRQRELRPVMIELALTPTLHIVTIRASVTQFSLVDIPRLVAGDAAGGSAAELLALPVTRLTRDAEVRARQGKIGRLVREYQSVQPGDVGATALVFAVARFAFDLATLTQSAMKTAALFKIACYVLMVMAGQALIGPALLSKALMTKIALHLDRRMGLRQLVRHQQRLKSIGLRGYRQQDQHAGDPTAQQVTRHPIHESAHAYRSVHMHGHHVKRTRDHQQNEQGHVQQMPQGKKTPIKRKFGDAHDGTHEQAHLPARALSVVPCLPPRPLASARHLGKHPIKITPHPAMRFSRFPPQGEDIQRSRDNAAIVRNRATRQPFQRLIQ